MCMCNGYDEAKMALYSRAILVLLQRHLNGEPVHLFEDKEKPKAVAGKLKGSSGS